MGSEQFGERRERFHGYEISWIRPGCGQLQPGTAVAQKPSAVHSSPGPSPSPTTPLRETAEPEPLPSRTRSWLGKRRLAEARELGQSIGAMPMTAESVLERSLQGIHELVGFERSLACLPALGDGAYHLEFAYFAGNFEPSRHRPRLASLLREAGSRPFSYFDPSHPPSSQRNRVVTHADLRRSRHRPASEVAEAFAAAGFDARQMMRLLVCEGEELLAWVGGFRPDPFGYHEEQLLGLFMRPLRKRLQIERRLSLGLFRAGLEAALEALNAPAYLVRPDGQIVHANGLGKALLDREYAERQAVIDASQAVSVEVSFDALPVQAWGLSPHKLVLRRTPGPASLALQLARAQSRWELTPQQARVLALMAEGEANKTLATRLRCSVATIEVHVSAILRKAGVDSRARLLAALWQLG
jgi:DNA-binding CsgD family transcriptional regulator/PAS domain-containing protein